MGLQKFGDARSASEQTQKTSSTDQDEPKTEATQQRLAALAEENDEADG